MSDEIKEALDEEKEVKLDDHDAWSEQFDYIMDVCMKMKKAFKKYL